MIELITFFSLILAMNLLLTKIGGTTGNIRLV